MDWRAIREQIITCWTAGDKISCWLYGHWVLFRSFQYVNLLNRKLRALDDDYTGAITTALCHIWYRIFFWAIFNVPNRPWAVAKPARSIENVFMFPNNNNNHYNRPWLTQWLTVWKWPFLIKRIKIANNSRLIVCRKYHPSSPCG